MEIGAFLSENEVLPRGPYHTATPSFLPFHHTCNTSNMVRGQPISDDLRKVILNMARHLDMAAIRHYTGCPTRSIQQLLADYRRTGTTIRARRVRERRGRRRVLISEDIHVSIM